MISLPVRVGVGTVAVAATLVLALATFVVGPVRVSAEREAGAAAAREARLAAQIIQLGGAAPSGAQLVTAPRPRTGLLIGVASLGDGRFMQVDARSVGPVIAALNNGLRAVVGTGILAAVGWLLWTGTLQRRRIRLATATVRRLIRGDLTQQESPDRRGVMVCLNDEIEDLRVRLAQATCAQATVVGIVAHDLRSPLAAVSLATERIERAGSTAEIAAACSLIRHECDRLAEITDDLLVLSSEAANAIQSGGRRVPVGSLLLDVAERLRIAGGPHVSVTIAAAAAEGVTADDRLVRSLMNLAENAVRYTPEGGEVHLIAKPGAGGGIDLIVEDDGPGIDETFCSEPEAFAQGAGCAGRSGLGLVSAHRAARSCGARLLLARRSEGGTRAVVHVPRDLIEDC